MYDFNVLERRASELHGSERDRDAMAIYLYMAEGDPSLDGGYLAMQIGACCERLGDLHSARWWYGRAVEENPTVSEYIEARARLDGVSIDHLME
jgi:hypothetical protein